MWTNLDLKTGFILYTKALKLHNIINVFADTDVPKLPQITLEELDFPIIVAVHMMYVSTYVWMYWYA